MDTIRAFIAIELPEVMRQRLDEVQKQIQALAGEPAHKAVRWVVTANLHLTLKFLGEVPGANIPALVEIMRAETARHTAFDFTVEGTGAFPNLRRPRVIWAGANAPSALLSLQKSIEEQTRRLGYPAEERPFSPHLTLGRVAQHAQPEDGTQLGRALEKIQVGVLGTVRIDQLHLFRSDLRPSGPIYTSLHSFRLADNQPSGK